MTTQNCNKKKVKLTKRFTVKVILRFKAAVAMMESAMLTANGGVANPKLSNIAKLILLKSKNCALNLIPKITTSISPSMNRVFVA